MSGRYSDWIDWEGGRCPVPKGTPVIAKYRDGHISGEVKALMMEKITSGTRYAIEWNHHAGENDIIAYRYWIEDDKEQPQEQYSDYFKDIRHIDYLDVYRTVDLFECEKHGHPISHAAKKLLLTGTRTGGKDVETDVREAIDSLHRWLEMREEDKRAL